MVAAIEAGLTGFTHLFRCVIVQQIYYRFFKGHTRDERFAKLNEMVGLLGRVAAGAIDGVGSLAFTIT